MCGIVGLIGDWPENLIGSLTEQMIHRGPDGDGILQEREHGVHLGMRRLSIIDVDSGWQPQWNEDRSIAVMMNGEIFNAPELRATLTAAGHQFRSEHSDTEVLVHLYEEHGDRMMSHLNGMFAFILYDKARRRLLVARDRFGIKPLYIHRDSRGLAMASELRVLLAVPGVSREVDLDALYHYVSLRYVPGKQSAFQNITRLRPGFAFTYDLASATLEEFRWWRIESSEPLPGDESDWIAAVREQLSSAVEMWSRSDVPVACSLSGGLDSSAIVGLMRDHNTGPLQTFSLGYGADGKNQDELDLARLVAQKWETEHHEIILDAETLLNDLPKMLWVLEEPFGGDMPSWYVYEAMARHVKVGLTGTGGDEVFGNYGIFNIVENHWSFRQANALGFSGSSLDMSLANVSKSLIPFLPGSSLKSAAAAAYQPFGRYPYYFSDTDKLSLLTDSYPRTTTTQSLFEGIAAEWGATNPRDACAFVGMQTILPEEFCLMADRFAMNVSLEARVPLLDHRLVELVYRIPAAQRLRASDPKWLLREAVKDLLPPPLLAAPKRGFVLPLATWLRNQLRPLVDRFLAPERLRTQGLFRPDAVRRIVQDHMDGRSDQSQRIWPLLTMQIWHYLFIEQCLTSAPTATIHDLA